MTGEPLPRRRHVLRYTGTLDRAAFEAECRRVGWWYHSYYFDNGFAVRGDYDIGADVSDYGFPEDLSGLRVLDIGTGAGWFAHYFWQCGSIVTTVDARGYEDFDVYGRPVPRPGSLPRDDPLAVGVYARSGRRQVPGPAGEVTRLDGGRRRPDRYDEHGIAVYDSPVSAGFWLMKTVLGSSITFRNARVYDVCPELFGGETFDLVFMGALLCHVRDPVGALMAARSVCRSQLIASTPVVIGEPESEVPPRQYLPYTDIDPVSWWLPNEACFRQWFLAAGFAEVDINREVTLRGDVEHRDDTGRLHNGDQIHRVAHASV